MLAARRSAEDGAGGAEVVLGAALTRVAAFEFDGGSDPGAGGVEGALGNNDWIGNIPPLPSLLASSVAAACKSARHGSAPCVALH